MPDLPPSCQTGGVSSASRYCSFGRCGAISGAKIATSTSSDEDDEAEDRALVDRRNSARTRRSGAERGRLRRRSRCGSRVVAHRHCTRMRGLMTA